MGGAAGKGLKVSARTPETGLRHSLIPADDLIPATSGSSSEQATPRAIPAASIAGAAAAAAEAAAAASAHAAAAATLQPLPLVMSREEFDATQAAGKFVAAQADLFAHPMVARQHAVTAAALQEVLDQGESPCPSSGGGVGVLCLQSFTMLQRCMPCMCAGLKPLHQGACCPQGFGHGPHTNTLGRSLVVQASCPCWIWKLKRQRPSRHAQPH